MFKKIMLIILIALLAIYALLWLCSIKKYDVEYGISFGSIHAESLGLNWKEVYREMLEDLHPKFVRVSVLWNQVQGEKGDYFFNDIDYMMNLAQENNTKVMLVIGQKAPRWPECHVPDWVNEEMNDKKVKEHLFDYISAVVERYKDHPALDLWQVENEPFIRFQFGKCERFQRDAVKDEIKLVHELDPKHKVVLTDSGELGNWFGAARHSDILGSTLYRVVQTPGGKNFEYWWLPAGLYKMKARIWGKSYDEFFISELQAEPWFSDSTPLDTPIKTQEKTMNPQRLKKHLHYTEHVGASRAYLWGVEWWYFMKEKNNDDRYWNLIKNLNLESRI